MRNNVGEVSTKEVHIVELNAQPQQEKENQQDIQQIITIQTETPEKKEPCPSSVWETVQTARHGQRPYAADYIRLICDKFVELSGDRMFGNDPSILAGPARLHGETVMLISQQKGRTTQEKQYHNFGMPHPEGYRKAYRLMKQAEKFGFPIICLIDTPGAFPGLEDEQHGQAGAIAENIRLMIRLRVPILAIIIGEGGSGGALALGVADRILMLEHSIYTVASPEAAASILWRDTAFAPDAAEAMKISAQELLQLGVIDDLILEPPGGAHRDYLQAATNLKHALLKNLTELKAVDQDEMLERRYKKYRHIGTFSRM